MRNFILIILFLIVKYSLFASNTISPGDSIWKCSDNLYYFKKDNHFGLVDSLGRFKQEPVYDRIEYFISGYYALIKDKLAGLVNSDGEMILPVMFKFMNASKNDEDNVDDEDKIYLLDTLELKREYLFKNKTLSYIKKGPHFIKNPNFSLFDTRSCLADSNGNCISDTFREIGEFGCGKVLAKKDSLVGYIDIKGRFTEEPRFRNYSFYSNPQNGYTIMWNYQTHDCLLDSCCNMVIPFYYDHLSFDGDYLIAQKNGKCGIITYNNDVVIPFEYDSLDVFIRDEENPIYIAKKDSLYGLITLKKAITPFIYSSLYQPSYLYYYAGNVGGINDGLLLTFHLDCFKEIRKPYIQAETKDKGYILSDKGDLITEGYIEKVDSTSNIIFENDDKYGLIKSHKVVIPAKFTQLTKRYEQIAENEKMFIFYEVHDENLVGLFSLNGDCIVPPIYAEINPNQDESYSYNYPMFVVKDTSEHIGVYNLDGKNIIPVEYDDISYMKQDAFEWFEVVIEDKYGIYDSNGNCIVPVKSHNLDWDFSEDEEGKAIDIWFIVENKELKGAYDYEGEQILKVKYKRHITKRVLKKLAKKKRYRRHKI